MRAAAANCKAFGQSSNLPCRSSALLDLPSLFVKVLDINAGRDIQLKKLTKPFSVTG
jgi:hypothetical protein